MNASKKILIVTRNLPPLIGGMERLNWHIADELSKNNEIFLVSHHEAKDVAPTSADFYGVRLNPLPLFLILAFFKTFILCITKKPDILFAGSGLTAPIVVFWAKIFRKKSIIYIHGLDIANINTLYNLIWVPLIRKADKVIANSQPTLDICLKKFIPKQNLHLIHPGVTYPPLPEIPSMMNMLIKKYNLLNKNILISVGRLTERKALNEFIDLSFPKIIEKIPNTVLVIIGDTPNHSLNKNVQSKTLISNTAIKHKIDQYIIFTGNISDDTLLSSWYNLATAHIFPVKHIPDDPEGFGMVAIEAAAHGTPTIAFKTGGIVDAVQQGVTGSLITPDNYDELSSTLIDLLQGKITYDKQHCKSYAENFSWQNLNRKLNELMS